jgi:hypothetical protein
LIVTTLAIVGFEVSLAAVKAEPSATTVHTGYSESYAHTGSAERRVTPVAVMTPHQPAASPNPLFREIVPKLRAETSLPILLPTKVVYDTATMGPLYANLDGVLPTGYSINFDRRRGCNGSGVCTTGFISSFAATGSIDTSIFRSKKSIVLQNGAIAVVAVPQYRIPTLITWDLNGRRYTIALPVPHFPQDLVTMANSMTALCLPGPADGGRRNIHASVTLN